MSRLKLKLKGYVIRGRIISLTTSQKLRAQRAMSKNEKKIKGHTSKRQHTGKFIEFSKAMDEAAGS